MIGQVAGNLLNIVLDPIMILGFGWNITGAAIATVIGNVAASGYYIFYYTSGKSSLSIKIKDFCLKDKICSSVLIIGIPASLGSILMSISQIIMNGMMVKYGDMALAGIGVAMKVTMMTGMLAMGIGQGVQPLLGYCVGARNWERYKRILQFSLWFAFILGLATTVLCYLFSNQIIHVFLTEKSAFDYALNFAKILLVTSSLLLPDLYRHSPLRIFCQSVLQLDYMLLCSKKQSKIEPDVVNICPEKIAESKIANKKECVKYQFVWTLQQMQSPFPF